MTNSNKDELKNAADQIVVKVLKHFYDTQNLGSSAISMSLGRTKRFSFTSVHYDMGYVWFVIYDLLGAVKQGAIKNPELIVVYLDSLAKYKKINFGELFKLFQKSYNDTQAVEVYRETYALGSDSKELQNLSKETEEAINFIGAKIEERSIIAKILNNKF